MAAVDITIPDIYNGEDQLYLIPDLITEEVERNLMDFLNSQTWSAVGSGARSRRVIHYGRRYDYKARRDAGPDGVLPIPVAIRQIADHLVKYGVMPRVDQVIVNDAT